MDLGFLRYFANRQTNKGNYMISCLLFCGVGGSNEWGGGLNVFYSAVVIDDITVFLFFFCLFVLQINKRKKWIFMPACLMRRPLCFL